MNYATIKDAIDDLTQKSVEIEALYAENGGEVTPDAELLEAEINALNDLLEGEGIDSLGRWLKAKEDEKARYKAEKAMADRRIKSIDSTIEFIKQSVGVILRVTNREKVKGTFYSFSQFTSTKTGYDADALDRKYLQLAIDGARSAGLPDNISVALKTTATALQGNDETAPFVKVEQSATSKYTKPRSAN